MKIQNRPIEALKQWASVRGRGLQLANALGVKPPSVSDWVTGKKSVPLEQCMPIERATEGEVTRRDLRPDDWQIHWPELAQAHTESLQAAIQTVAEAQAAIKHVEAAAVAEIKHVADEILKDGEPWDGINERRTTEQLWDGVTERRKLNAPLDRRVSPESVARAAFLRSQVEAGSVGKVA